MARGFGFADGSPDLLRLYVPRAIALIAAFPDRASEFPDPQDLRDVTKGGFSVDEASDLPAHLRADLCDGLLVLARNLENALSGASAVTGERAGAAAKPSVRVA
jgi:hypothetical protein